MHVANPRPKRPGVSVIDAIANESDLGVFGGNDEGKSFVWDLGQPLSGYNEQLQGNVGYSVNDSGAQDDTKNKEKYKSPSLYEMDFDFNTMLPHVQSNDGRNKYGGGSAPPTLENEFDDGLADFSIGSTRVLNVPLKGSGSSSNLEGGILDTGRNSADLILNEGGSGAVGGAGMEMTSPDATFVQRNGKNGIQGGYEAPPGFRADGSGRGGGGYRESKSTEFFDSTFFGSAPFARSSSAPMQSLEGPNDSWGNGASKLSPEGVRHNLAGLHGTQADETVMHNNHGGTAFTYGEASHFDVQGDVGGRVLSAPNLEMMEAQAAGRLGSPRAYSDDDTSKSGLGGSEEGKNTGIDLNNLPMPSVAPPNSVEAIIIQGCAEILVEASSHSLKAVELANTLRARVHQNYLAQIRERWGGLLALLEQAKRVFRVRRVPKNDTVGLLLPGDTDEDSSPPRSRRDSRDPHSDNEKDSFGRSTGSRSGYSSGDTSEGGDESRTKEHTSRCLHVGNVPSHLTEQQLYEEFEKFGEVEGLKIVAHRSRRFAFVTFSTIEQAISAKQRLVKLTPWKSAISYAHKESITPPQPPKNYTNGGADGSTGYKVGGRTGRGSLAGQPVMGITGAYPSNGMTAFDNQSSRPLAGFEHGMHPPAVGGYGMQTTGRGVDGTMMGPWGQSHIGVSMGGMQGGPMVAAGAGTYMQQRQSLHPDTGMYDSTGPPLMDHLDGSPALISTPLSGAVQCAGPGSSGELAADAILRRLCDSTFVPTRDWPVDGVNDQQYVSAVVLQLQQFHGYTSISKLRSALKSRLMSSDNIKSVPLKALLAAYPKYFVVKGNQVSLCMVPKH